jgi:hypothetical protein
MALRFDEWSAATSRAEGMREHAKVGKGSNRLNYILKSTGTNFPKDWESIWRHGKTSFVILYATNHGDHALAFHLYLERIKNGVPKNSRL